MSRITRRFLNEQQTILYQQFLRTGPTDDQQLDYLRDNFENLTAREIFHLFQILNLRAHPRYLQNLTLHQEIRNRVEFQQPIRFPQPNPAGNNMAAPAPIIEEFIDDPFDGNINPGTKTGAQLYLKATASISEEDKFELIWLGRARSFCAGRAESDSRLTHRT